MEEIWKPITHFPSYVVSNHGRVKRIVGWKQRPHFVPTILKPGFKSGYPFVSLYKNNVNSQYQIHQLVAQAFHGPIPKGHHINHKNFKRNDNRPENLEYVTPKQNVLYTVLNLRHAFGERCGQSKLTDKKVKRIRKYLQAGCTVSCVAYRFGVSRKTMYSLVHGESWRHVTKPHSLGGKSR